MQYTDFTDEFLTFSVSHFYRYTRTSNFIYAHMLSMAFLVPFPTKLTNSQHNSIPNFIKIDPEIRRIRGEIHCKIKWFYMYV